MLEAADEAEADLGPPAGRRPVGVLTRDAAIELLTAVTCAPTTRTLRGIRSGVEVGPAPVIHLHGTPGCRLELAFADDVMKAAGVRIIAFGRPGYGGSTQTPFGLASVAGMAVELADRLGVDQFRTTGWSGGGPFA